MHLALRLAVTAARAAIAFALATVFAVFAARGIVVNLSVEAVVVAARLEATLVVVEALFRAVVETTVPTTLELAAIALVKAAVVAPVAIEGALTLRTAIVAVEPYGRHGRTCARPARTYARHG